MNHTTRKLCLKGRMYACAHIAALLLLLHSRLSAQDPRPSFRPPAKLVYLDEEDWAPCFALRFSLTVTRHASVVTIAFDCGNSAGYHALVVNKGLIGFYIVDSHGTRRLGDPGHLSAGHGTETVEMTLRRDEWEMSAICDDRVVAIAYDCKLMGGKVGISAPEGTIGDLRYQPTEPPYFADDFMRGSKESGEWKSCSGEWRLAGIEDDRIDPKRSSNAFTYEGLPGKEGVAATVAGRWFWGPRRIEVAVKPLESEAVGVFVYWRDAENYLLVRWNRNPEGKLELVRRRGGKEETLKQRRGGFAPGQWYLFSVAGLDGFLEVTVDGQALLRTASLDFGQGLAGLYVKGPPRSHGARFDDARITGANAIIEDFSLPSVGKWTDSGSGWQTDRRFNVRRYAGSSESFSVMEPSAWRNYNVETTVRFSVPASTRKTQCIGLALCFQDCRNTCLLRLRMSPSGRKLELLRRKEGAELLLDSADVPAVHREMQLKVSCDHGYLTGSVQGGPIVTTVDDSFLSGRCGLYAMGAHAEFKDVRVRFQYPERTQSKEQSINPQFAKEILMSGWATPQGAWVEQGGAWVHKGYLFGDARLGVTLPRGKTGNSLAIGIGEAEAMLEWDAGAAAWRVARFLDKPCASGPKLPPEANAFLERRGQFIIMSNETKPLLWKRAPEAIPGEKATLKPVGLSLSWEGVTLTSPCLLDDTFARAPVRWRAQRGVWQTMQRWTCGPSWSFFGGWHEWSPVLWSKEFFTGDQVVEFYAGTQMNPGLGDVSPSDLNVTLCGDGINLGSGYSFIFAGLRQKVCRLYRRDLLLAEKPYQPTPSFSPHQGWFYVRAERRGHWLRLSVNDTVLLEAVDPQPLPGGYLSFWSYNAQPLLARTRVWYRSSSSGKNPTADWPQPFFEHPRSQSPETQQTVRLPLKCDFETTQWPFTDRAGMGGAETSLDSSTFAGGKQSLRISNADSGGPFTVWIIQNKLELPAPPVMEFDYRVPPQVKVNFYARLSDGQWREIRFTASEVRPAEDQSPNPTPPCLITDVKADGQWHHASFSFAVLSGSEPQKPFMLSGLAIASPSEPYLRCGIGGNPFGAAYHLDNFVIQLPP